MRATTLTTHPDRTDRTPRGRRTGAGGRGEEPEKPKKPKLQRLRGVMPYVWELMAPRKGMLALGLLLIAFNRVASLVLPASTKFLVDDVIGRRQVDLLWPIVGGVLAATLLQGGTSFVLTQILSKEAQKLIAHMRQQVQIHVGRLPVAYFDATKAGNLVTRIMTDVEGVRNLVGTGLVEFAGGLIAATFALALMVRISPGMTGVTLLAFAAFSGVLIYAFRLMRPIFRERGKIYSEVSGRLTESLGGVRVVKGYRAEPREEEVFATGVGRLLDNVMRTMNTQSLLALASSVLLGLVGAAIMYVGARQILSGAMTVGGFFTYSMLLGFLVAPLFQVVSIGTQITEALAGLERTHEVLAEAREDHDPHRVRDLAEVRGHVVFEDVHFAYEPEKPVLHGVSFEAPPGTVTALVGPSGAGKSTIIGLVAAFHAPTAGRILLDGIDLSTVKLDAYRQLLGVVLQETFLFDGTIHENVAFSRPDASPEAVLEACRISRVDEFAEKFPDGYDTIVGERGVKLSGGQRQRVSIARALLADPRLLILDEATSSLDSESEALIQQGLARLLRGRTTFVIAHRLSTIRRADQILVVEEGRVVERGTHAQLYVKAGRYREMYDRQHAVQSDLFLAPGEGDKVPEAEPEPEGAAAPGGGARLL